MKLLTPNQQKKKDRNDKLIPEYYRLKAEKQSAYAIICFLAKKYKVSRKTVYNIIKTK